MGSFSSGIVEVLGLISNFIRIAQRQAQFSPGGERVTARIWNPKTSQLLAVLNAQGGGVFDAVITADGAQVATASEDWTARIWKWDFLDFGTQTSTFTDPNLGSSQVSAKQHINELKLGINYRFGNRLPY